MCEIKGMKTQRYAKGLGRPWRTLALQFLCVVCLSIGAWADEIHFRDGRVLQVVEIWESGETVWYRQGAVIVSTTKAEIVRIVKASDLARPATSPAAPRAKGQAGPAAPLKLIVLNDGTRIEADSVWEESGQVVYRMGRMQVYIDRSEVKSLLPASGETVEPAPAPLPFLAFSTGHRGLDQLIVYSATKYELDPLLIYLVMREESGFNYRAVSRAGARGLMQLMPGTALRLGVRNIHNPYENVDAGTRHLRKLLEMFNGDVNLALAAYNAGEAAVLRYGRRIPPYQETMNYVWRINTAYRRATAAASSEPK